MSGMQRKGTVSKSSGPVHVNSYALKGVPVRYNPPFYIPDLMTLPASLRLPVMPTGDEFRYDYTRENQVLEQARIRTLSLAAEAQARERREQQEAEERRRREAAAAEQAKTTSSATLPPPLIPSPGSAILTPTPAAPVVTSNARTGTATSTSSSGVKEGEREGGEGGQKPLSVLKPLGELSLSEFEGDNFNPFDAASLQAINDMEVLQTISLVPVAGESSSAPASSAAVSSAASEGQTTFTASGLQTAATSTSGVTVAPLSAPHSSPAALPPSMHQQAASPAGVQQATPVPLPRPSLPTRPVLPPIGSNLSHSTSQLTNTSTDTMAVQRNNSSSSTDSHTSTPPAQAGLPAYAPTSRAPATTSPGIPPSTFSPPVPGSLAGSSHPLPISGNPFLPPSPYPILPVQSQSSPAGGLSSSPHNPFLPPPPVAATAGQSANVGTLVDLGVGVSATPSLPGQQATPIQTAPVPIPKPRSFTTTPVSGQQIPNGPHPILPGSAPQPHPPVVPPKRRHAKPPAAHSTVQARANTLMATLQPGQSASRPGLGVPVLPPIHSATQQPPPAAPSGEHPVPSLPPPSFPTPHLPPPPVHPPYTPSSTTRSDSPPPPYFAEQQGMETRRFSQPVPPPPSHYTLPDPQGSLSAEEKREVQSIAGMGFPAPRVARAVKKFSNDRTQVLDFLVLVSKVEEDTGAKGDSAETALAVCKDDENKAARYLQKVSYYKDSGFSEKAIHEAYEEAGRDWDKALDILTQHSR